MKTFQTLILILAIAVVSCEKEASEKNVLSGKWELKQTYMSIGGPLVYTDVPKENQTFLEFKDEGKLIYTNSDFVRYAIKDSITLSFFKKDNSRQDFYYRVDSGLLDLSPGAPYQCIEGCGSRFKNVAIEY